jgi:hypothetical protein
MTDDITLKLSTEADSDRIQRLAELDGGHAPRGEVLLAEVDGRLVAAVSVDGTAVADPFLPTADVVRLLRGQLTGERSRRPRRSGWLGRLRAA